MLPLTSSSVCRLIVATCPVSPISSVGFKQEHPAQPLSKRKLQGQWERKDHHKKRVTAISAGKKRHLAMVNVCVWPHFQFLLTKFRATFMPPRKIFLKHRFRMLYKRALLINRYHPCLRRSRSSHNNRWLLQLNGNENYNND